MGKGTNTTTTQSGPNPIAGAAYTDLINRAGNVAQTPYQAYGGDLTAPINAQQQAGIANINQGAGFASPYIQEAAGYARNAAQPLTQAQIQQYLSPYTQNVVDSTTNWFNNQNQQQQQNVIGNAASAGALGGDRVGVAQANLAAQQTASQAPVIAGLYNQGYTQALGTAQQQQQNRANAAYSIGNLGVSGQNAALTGANAQVGAGNLQQQNEQQRLNAAYQQFQIQQAFPYQQTQWLAGVDTGVGSQLGGQSSTTGPAPNPLSSILGLGVAGLGVAGGLGWKPFAASGGRINGFAPGGAVQDAPYAGVGWVPARTITVGRGAPPPPNTPQTPPSGLDLAKMSTALAGRGNSARAGDIPLPLMPPGVASYAPSPVGATYGFGSSPAGPLGPIYRHGGGVHGYAEGGAPGFADRWAPVPEAVSAGVFDPQGANAGDFGLNPTPVRTERFLPADYAGGVPMPRERPEEAPQVAGFGPSEDGRAAIARATGAQDDDTDPSQALSFAPGVAAPTGRDDDALSFAPTAGVAAAPHQPTGGGFANLSLPLITAGLGMMASRSPFLANAIGEGGLAGVAAYTGQKQAELQHAEKQQSLGLQTRHMDNETKRLEQAAEQARKHLAETSRHNLAVEQRQSEAQQATQMQPVRIGTDKDGRELYGIRDPKTQAIIPLDPATGQPAGAAPASKPQYLDPRTNKPIPQTEADADGVIPKNAQLVSSGQPYDYSTDGPYIEKGMDLPKPAPVSNKSSGAIETDGQNFLQTGKLPPVAKGKSPVAIQQNKYRDAVQNYGVALAASRGITPEQTVEMWRTAPGMLRFILGADGRATVSLGTAVRHLDTVQELAKAWAANDTQGINRLRAIISRQFGSEAGTNLEAAGKIVGPEIIKALGVAGAGTEKDRDAAGAQFSTATSPAQLAGAVQTVQKLLGGQLEGKKRQASAAGVSDEKFRGLVGERPYEILSNLEKAPTSSKPKAPERATQNGYIYERQPDGTMKAVGKAP